jgi:hypothetical protein
VLFIVGSVAGAVSLGGLTGPILDGPDYLAQVSAHDTTVIVGALLELVMGVALVGVALAVYPVLKRFSERLALGYLGVRLVELAIGVISVISLLSLVTVSREAAGAGSLQAPSVRATGTLLQAVRDWAGHSVLDLAVFPIGALILNYVFFRARLVPRWLSAWGLAGALLYWTAGLLVTFAAIVPLEAAHLALQAPLGLQEMVMAVWLITRGFNRSALPSAPASTGDRDAICPPTGEPGAREKTFAPAAG